VNLDINNILDAYKKGYSINHISKLLGCSVTPIRRILKENAISTKRSEALRSKDSRKYNIDENFFEKIDSEEKAYVLGYLYADGNIHKSKTNVQLELSEKDIYILLTIKNILKSNHKLFKHNIKINNKEYINYRLTITNYKILKDLLNIGLEPAKSLKIKFPKIEKQLLRHFVRGYFDGDGCIYHKERNGIRVYNPYAFLEISMLGSESFCKSLKTILKKEINVDMRLDKSGKNKRISRLRTSKQESIIKIYKWFYSDATIYLKRKYDSFKEINDFLLNKGI
jgi:hypothetical protein